MKFLIDENLPYSLMEVFTERGFQAEHAGRLSQLHGQPDEVVFNYAVKAESVIVTKDLGFSNPIRFSIDLLKGLIIIRFPNEISVKTLRAEVRRLTADFNDTDFQNLIVIEPGFIRSKKLH